jgi:hypothetical protein
MSTLVDRLLPDALWQRIQPLLPPAPARPRGGVPRRVPDRNCVAALIFMARTSTPLEPAARQGTWLRLGHYLLAPPRRVGWRGRVRAAAGTAAGRARPGRPHRPGAGQRGLLQPAGGQRGDLTGANPVDRGKAGSKLHLAGDAGPPRSTPTKPMTIAAAERTCAGVASAPGSPGVGSSPQPGLAATAGRSSGPARGWAASGGCGSATSAAPDASMPWRCWPVRSFASTPSDNRPGHRTRRVGDVGGQRRAPRHCATAPPLGVG